MNGKGWLSSCPAYRTAAGSGSHTGPCVPVTGVAPLPLLSYHLECREASACGGGALEGQAISEAGRELCRTLPRA